MYKRQDDYALELRSFIDDHSGDDELSRLKGIPIGKWNYLPQKNQEVIPDTNEVYALFSANGRMTGTNELVHDTGFVKIAKTGANRGPFSQVRASYVDCLLYTSDAADEEDSVDIGGTRIIKKKNNKKTKKTNIYTSKSSRSKNKETRKLKCDM